MIINKLIERYPDVKSLEENIRLVVNEIVQVFKQDRQLLICGNGGSAADSDHIATEFLKGFMSKRPLPEKERNALIDLYGKKGEFIANRLQVGFKALPLPVFTGLNTAFANDVAPELAFAQMVNALGRKGDLLLSISTSGNAENVCSAAMVGKAKGLKVIALTGNNGGKLASLSDILIVAPGDSTPDIQERHVPIYHAICRSVEIEMVQ